MTSFLKAYLGLTESDSYMLLFVRFSGVLSLALLVTCPLFLAQLGPQATQLPVAYFVPSFLPLHQTEGIVRTWPPLTLRPFPLLLWLPLIVNLYFHCICTITWVVIIIKILLPTSQSEDGSPLLLTHSGPPFPAPPPHVQLRDLHFRTATLQLLEAEPCEKHQNVLF